MATRLSRNGIMRAAAVIVVSLLIVCGELFFFGPSMAASTLGS
jgi:hypothetical protein